MSAKDDDAVDWGNPDYGKYDGLFDRSGDFDVLGETTPAYCFWPNSIERIAKYNPEAKIIMLLRHPAFRAHSHWRMTTSRRWEARSFSDAVRQTDLEAPGLDRGSALRTHSYVQRGFYSWQAERILSQFSGHQVMFIRTDRLWSEPNAILGSIAEFLNISPFEAILESAHIAPIRADAFHSISVEDRRYLNQVYSEDIRRLSRITGTDVSDWQDPNYSEPMTRSSLPPVSR